MLEYLSQHLNRYELTALDAVKLLYQGQFGVNHLIELNMTTKASIESEIAVAKNEFFAQTPQIEKVSDKFSRLNLHKCEKLHLDTISRIVSLSSDYINSDKSAFLGELFELASRAKFDPRLQNTKMNEYVVQYIKDGLPMVSHSDQYRNKYFPHYRIIQNRFACHIEAFEKIDELKKNKKRIFVSIEGGSASGKSTLAKCLQEVYGATVFHTDDYFLPISQKTKERLDEAGGNVDYERIREELIDNFSKDTLSYAPFSCKLQKRTAPLEAKLGDVVVLEGVYSRHPHYNFDFDLNIFLDISEEEQSVRILKRNGQDMLTRFQNEWIPLEKKYFETFKIKEKSDLII